MTETYWTYYNENDKREECEFDTMEEAHEYAQNAFALECEGDINNCGREVEFQEFSYHDITGEPIEKSKPKVMVYSHGYEPSQLGQHGITSFGGGGA